MATTVDAEAASRAGFSAERLRWMGRVLELRVADREVPGAVLVCGRGGETAAKVCAGFALDAQGMRREMTEGTIFDLASLTKVCATLPAVLALVDDGALSLSDSVASFIPSYRDAVRERITVRHLLTHTSGLPAGRPLHEKDGRGGIWEQVLRIAPEHPPGSRVVYSDIGFMVLGRVVETVSGMRLDPFVQERLYRPLGLRSIGFRPLESSPPLDPRRDPGFAATEVRKDSGGIAYAAVHDENAHALGGVAGHAGLFADAEAVARVLRMWVDGGLGVLSRASVSLSVQNATAGLDGRRGLGWSLRGDGFDPTGDLWPDTAFSHTGFTGTSAAADPVSGVWMVLLTNRVHYGRGTAVAPLRRAVHNAFASAVGDWSGPQAGRGVKFT